MSDLSKSDTNPENGVESVTGAATKPQGADGAAQQPTPLRCLVGAVLAGVLAFAMYRMTNAIAFSFATHPIHATTLIVQRISAAVRTLVVGMTTLGMGVFGLAAIGLLGLAIQLLLQRRQQADPPAS